MALSIIKLYAIVDTVDGILSKGKKIGEFFGVIKTTLEQAGDENLLLQ